jgi:hypothetical protein
MAAHHPVRAQQTVDQRFDRPDVADFLSTRAASSRTVPSASASINPGTARESPIRSRAHTAAVRTAPSRSFSAATSGSTARLSRSLPSAEAACSLIAHHRRCKASSIGSTIDGPIRTTALVAASRITASSSAISPIKRGMRFVAGLAEARDCVFS